MLLYVSPQIVSLYVRRESEMFSPNVDEMVIARFTLSLGVFVRKSVISQIKSTAFMQGVTLEIEEDKGFLESAYRVKMTGKRSIVTKICAAIKSLEVDMAQINPQQ